MPSVSMIISAYNEESVIQKKLENSLQLEYPSEKIEVVVASESTDRTDSIASSYASRGIRLLSFSPRRGKPSTLFRAVPQTSGEILLFSDSNALYAPDSIRKLMRNFADPRIGCVSGLLHYRTGDVIGVGQTESLYWRFESWVKICESQLFSLLGANGSIFAIRRALYSPLNEFRGDDFELPISVLIQGKGVVLEAEAASFEEVSASGLAEYNRRVRIVRWSLISAFMLIVKAFRAHRLLIGIQIVVHKILRWVTLPMLLILLAATALLPTAPFRAFLCIQLILYAFAFAGWLLDLKKQTVPGIFRVPYYFVLLQTAAAWGIVKAFATATPTWDKVR